MDETTLSYATIERGKVAACKSISNEVREGWKCPKVATVHWDMKSVEKLTTKHSREERLPVMISGRNKWSIYIIHSTLCHTLGVRCQYIVII